MHFHYTAVIDSIQFKQVFVFGKNVNLLELIFIPLWLNREKKCKQNHVSSNDEKKKTRWFYGPMYIYVAFHLL